MARRYQLTFKFFDTEKEAKSFCDKENTIPYIRKNHPATYTNWTSTDDTEHKFVVWYAY